jgi:2-methylcitrate dehydratase PrpD
MTLVEQLASFAVRAEVPEEVRTSVRQRVLDILGLCAAAAGVDTSEAVIGHAVAQGGTPQAHGVGVSGKLPGAAAALVNGTLAHTLDFDDTHLPSIIHPSAPVIPAALAAGEVAGATGAEVVRAAAVGLEICVRLGMAGYDAQARTSLYFERGQHATSMCGSLGGAAAAALLVGADPMHAMGVAASMASGIFEANRGGGTVKRLHCGWAAHAALVAADLAARGFTGPPTVLEGRFGFFTAFLDGRFDAEAITEGLGERWSVPGIVFKPYPANHFTHTTADAGLALRAAGVRPEDIEAVEIRIAAPTVRSVGEPIEAKRAPQTGYQAQFSAPYVFTAALLGGSGLGVGLDDFTDALANDPARRKLMARIDVTGDEECTRIYPHAFPAVVCVRLRDGSERTERVMHNRGGPQQPLSDEELERKFRDNARRTLSGEATAAVEDACKRLETLDSLNDLLAPTAKGW